MVRAGPGERIRDRHTTSLDVNQIDLGERGDHSIRLQPMGGRVGG